MTRSSERTRQRILEAAYELFYRDGFARVGVDTIAAEAGVTKRALYYHYPSKDALLAAVLDFQHGFALRHIQDWAADASNDPVQLVEHLFDGLALWAADPKWKGSGFTRLTMELAGLPGHPARAAASTHKAAVEAWLADVLAQGGVADAKETARQIMLLSEGCLSLILIHGDTSYARTAAAVAKRLVR
ncbi:MAG: TetR/AcrR family transcriptional regulator, partial [Methyloligellaceae bacterium]